LHSSALFILLDDYPGNLSFREEIPLRPGRLHSSCPFSILKHCLKTATTVGCGSRRLRLWVHVGHQPSHGVGAMVWGGGSAFLGSMLQAIPVVVRGHGWRMQPWVAGVVALFPVQGASGLRLGGGLAIKATVGGVRVGQVIWHAGCTGKTGDGCSPGQGQCWVLTQKHYGIHRSPVQR